MGHSDAGETLKSTDEALYAIEAIDSFPKSVPIIIDDVRGNLARYQSFDWSEPAFLLKEAAKPAFDAETWHVAILSSLHSLPARFHAEDPRFIAASEALLKSYAVSAAAFEQNDKVAQGDIVRRLTERSDKAELETLASLMALPDTKARRC